MSYEYIEFITKHPLFIEAEYDDSIFRRQSRLSGRHHLFDSSRIPHSDVISERYIRRAFRLLFLKRKNKSNLLAFSSPIVGFSSRVYFNFWKVLSNIFSSLQSYSIKFINSALLSNSLIFVFVWFSRVSVDLLVNDFPLSNYYFNSIPSHHNVSRVLFRYKCSFVLERFMFKIFSVIVLFKNLSADSFGQTRYLRFSFIFFRRFMVRFKFLFCDLLKFCVFFISIFFDREIHKSSEISLYYETWKVFLEKCIGDILIEHDKIISDVSYKLGPLINDSILIQYNISNILIDMLKKFHYIFNFLTEDFLSSVPSKPNFGFLNVTGSSFKFAFFFSQNKFIRFFREHSKTLNVLLSQIPVYTDRSFLYSGLRYNMPKLLYSLWPIRRPYRFGSKKSYNFFLDYDLPSKFCNTMMTHGRRSKCISVLRKCFVYLRTRLYRVKSSRVLVGCVLRMRPELTVSVYKKSGKSIKIFTPVRTHIRLFYAFRNLLRSAYIRQSKWYPGELDVSYGFALFNELYAVAKGDQKCSSYNYYNEYHDEVLHMRTLCRKKPSLVSVPKNFDVFNTYNNSFLKKRDKNKFLSNSYKKKIEDNNRKHKYE